MVGLGHGRANFKEMSNSEAWPRRLQTPDDYSGEAVVRSQEAAAAAAMDHVTVVHSYTHTLRASFSY